MTAPHLIPDPHARGRGLLFLAPILLALAVAAAYSNTPGNAFALDDWHTIQQNPWIRRLDLPTIRRYFTDASAFSVLKTNLDYRPVLLVTYAVNYAISGYETASWHVVNLVLHWTVALNLFFVGRALIGSGGIAPIPRLSPRDGDLASLGSALVFAIHPVGTACANYISCRSSLLVAAFLMPALALYLAILARRIPVWALPLPLLLFTLALFTKVEAAAFFGVLILAELLLAPSLRNRPLHRRIPGPAALLRLALFLLATAAYLYIWKAVSPLDGNTQRAAFGITRGAYLLTEVRAWWYYIAQALAPVRLVADESAYPVSGGIATALQREAGEPLYSTARALADPRAFFAITAWLGVALLCLRALRPAPVIPFLVGAYLILLSPHSSIIPLSEYVNEHRPYLPISGLFLLASAGLLLAVRALSPSPRTTFILALLLLSIPLVALTRDRNAVWRDDLSLWSDTAAKTPESPRAQLNYGLALYNRARYDEAEARYRRALALAPNYHYAHTDLGILLAVKGDTAAAAASHDAAVAAAPAESGPYLWRGRFRAKQGDIAGAAADFQAAAERNPSPYTEVACLVECLERLGRGPDAQSWLDRFPAPDPAGFQRDREAVRSLFPAPAQPTSMGRMTDGLALMRQRRLTDAEALFRDAVRLDPSNHYAHSNMGVVLAAQGKAAEALDWHSAAVRLAPDHASPLYWRGRHHAAQNNLPAAIADLQAATDRAGTSLREPAALIECLLRAGRSDEARAVISRTPASPDLDTLRASFRSEVPAPP